MVTADGKCPFFMTSTGTWNTYYKLNIFTVTGGPKQLVCCNLAQKLLRRLDSQQN